MYEEINYIGKSILPENERELITHLIVLLGYSDPNYKILIDRKDDELIGHITVSKPEFRQDIIDNMLWLNKHLHAHIIFSKSLKISNKVSFTIPLTKENLEKHKK